MSLIITAKIFNGIVMIGDDKPSRIETKTENGETKNKIYFDKKRGSIRKIFFNNHFMLGTYGNNQLIYKEKAGIKGFDINIEDVLKEYVEDEKSNLYVFITKFKTYLEETSDNRTFNFVVYDFLLEEIYILEFDDKKFKSCKMKESLSIEGAQLYVKEITNIKENQHLAIKGLKKDEFNKTIGEIIEHVRTLIKDDQYDSVGTKFDEIFYNTETKEITLSHNGYIDTIKL